MKIKHFLSRRFYPLLKHILPSSELAEPDAEHPTDVAPDAYNDRDITEIVCQKTKNLITGQNPLHLNKKLNPSLLALEKILHRNAPKLNVFEVGGACGADYFLTERFFPNRINRWLIYETPKMARTGQENFSNQYLSFTDEFNHYTQLATKDLCIAKGSIQYIPEAMAFLKKLLSLQFKYVYISRQNIIDGSEPVITVQTTPLSAHGPGQINVTDKTKHVPITYIPSTFFFNEIQHYNYNILLQTKQKTYLKIKSKSKHLRVSELEVLLQLH